MFVIHIRLNKKLLRQKKNEFKLRLSIMLCSIQNSQYISYHFKNQNNREQISSHSESRSILDFSTKF